jgi:predicted AAA+ superfamily ATPase
MAVRKRIYDSILAEHLAEQRQMAFVSGPRQVGKTTTCSNFADKYLNWDNTNDRMQIIKGPAVIAEQLGLTKLRKGLPTVLFDELHKFSRWKQFLKGFFDAYSNEAHILVTGSSRMDIYRRGGDSLMGRYFSYRMHPFTVAEVIRQDLPDTERIIRNPSRISNTDLSALWTHGGYPEPFIKRDLRFSRRWRTLRQQQLLREDMRDLTQIHQLDQLEILVNLLISCSSHQLVYSNLANEIQVSIDTVRRWISTLCNLHLGFLIRPWYKNVSRSLRKEPKWYLRDWSVIDDPGDKAETFIACHLLKAVEGWNDLGLGNFKLGYLRDKNQREVDFIVVKNDKPWFLAEVKNTESALSPSLKYHQQQLKAPFAFQIVIEQEYVDADCFGKQGRAVIVPATTFLSQLL